MSLMPAMISALFHDIWHVRYVQHLWITSYLPRCSFTGFEKCTSSLLPGFPRDQGSSLSQFLFVIYHLPFFFFLPQL